MIVAIVHDEGNERHEIDGGKAKLFFLCMQLP